MKKKENYTDTLVESLSAEISSTTIDLGIDYAELALDSSITIDVLSEVPIFKSIYTGAKIYGSIRSFYTARNLMTFLRSFHSNKVDNEDLVEFENRFKKDTKYRDKVVDLIIQYNDRFIQSRKSKVFANLFLNYIQKRLSWNKLQSMLQIIDIMNPRLMELLPNYFESSPAERSRIENSDEGLIFGCGIGFRHGNAFRITEIGEELYKYGLKGIE